MWFVEGITLLSKSDRHWRNQVRDAILIPRYPSIQISLWIILPFYLSTITLPGALGSGPAGRSFSCYCAGAQMPAGAKGVPEIEDSVPVGISGHESTNQIKSRGRNLKDETPIEQRLEKLRDRTGTGESKTTQRASENTRHAAIMTTYMISQTTQCRAIYFVNA